MRIVPWCRQTTAQNSVDARYSCYGRKANIPSANGLQSDLRFRLGTEDAGEIAPHFNRDHA
jgi:hypothetical protein